MTQVPRRLVVVDEGSGPAVVLVHGQPGSTLTWERVRPLLTDLGLRVLTVDRPGYGRTGGLAADLAGNAAAINAVLAERWSDSAVRVGHSHGAAVALATAALYPRRVLSLVLVAPAVGPEALGWPDRALASRAVGPALTWLGFRGLGVLLSAGSLRTWLVVSRMGVEPVDSYEVVDRLRRGAMWRTFLAEQRELVRSGRGAGRDAARRERTNGAARGQVRPPRAAQGDTRARRRVAGRIGALDGGRSFPARARTGVRYPARAARVRLRGAAPAGERATSLTCTTRRV